MSREFVLRNKRKDELVQIILDLETEIAEKEPSEGSNLNGDNVCGILRNKIKELKKELSQSIENAAEWSLRARKAWNANEQLKKELERQKQELIQLKIKSKGG